MVDDCRGFMLCRRSTPPEKLKPKFFFEGVAKKAAGQGGRLPFCDFCEAQEIGVPSGIRTRVIAVKGRGPLRTPNAVNKLPAVGVRKPGGCVTGVLPTFRPDSASYPSIFYLTRPELRASGAVRKLSLAHAIAFECLPATFELF